MTESREIRIPRLVDVSAGSASRIPELLASAFDATRVCVGIGGGPSREGADAITSTLRDAGIEVSVHDCLEGRLDQAADLAGAAIRERATLLVGVGGGRVIDTVKLAAARTGTDFVSVPTAVSHDGICSPVASLRDERGIRGSHAAAMPAGIVIDLAVIAAAPPRSVRAGIGDLLSNLVALLDWELAAERGHERYDAFAAIIAEKAARSALEIDDLEDADSHQALAKGLLLSGLAMAAAGTSRPCSGSEHLISHSLDAMLGERAALHGEQVAVASLFAAAAHDSPLLETLGAKFELLGVPATPAALGISGDEFLEAVRLAPATRPDRFTVLTELVESGGDRIPKLAERVYEPARA